MVEDDQVVTIARRLGMLASAKNLRLATAESCTGGGLAQVITAVPGSSGWFECGFITYSNKSKYLLLGVEPNLIESCGAVSREVVEQMVKGAIGRSGVDLAIAVSGVAGPGGGTTDKPVGSVWLAWLIGQSIFSERFLFTGERADIRYAAICAALDGIVKRLQNAV